MAKIRCSKNGTMSINGLTKDEYYVLSDCLWHCKDAMKWDDEMGMACDGERFLWEIDDKKEFETLMKLEI